MVAPGCTGRDGRLIVFDGGFLLPRYHHAPTAERCKRKIQGITHGRWEAVRKARFHPYSVRCTGPQRAGTA